MGASVVPKSTGLRPSPPCTIVIFGAAGDLTKRKLLPALYNLKASGLLPRQLAIVGVTRPGDFGADMMHYNPHKTFSGPPPPRLVGLYW